MKRWAIILGLSGAVVACAHLARQGGAGARQLRVMSYNIRSGNGDLATTAATIRSFSPDIVGLQEVDVHWAPRSNFADQATELGDRLHMEVRFAHIYDLPPTREGDSRREFGVALLSRFPITSWNNLIITRLSTQEAQPVPTPMPGFLEATLNVDGNAVRVFNTHLDYRSDPRVREQQVRDMLGFIGDADVPTLLLGDLNAGPNAAELQPLRARLRDAWPDSAGSGFTYPAEKPEKRIDYVMASDYFRARAIRVPDTQASDHRPVVADLLFSPAGR